MEPDMSFMLTTEPTLDSQIYVINTDRFPDLPIVPEEFHDYNEPDLKLPMDREPLHDIVQVLPMTKEDLMPL